MEESTIAGLALGELINAVNGFLADPDPTGRAWFLAADCLELTYLLAETGATPELTDTDLPPAKALDEAARLIDTLPRTADWLLLRAAVQAVQIRAGA